MRAVAVLACGLVGCASMPPTGELHVPAADRVPLSREGLAVIYDARVCSLTLREESIGRVSSYRVPDGAWHVQNTGYPSTLLTVVPLGPGRYRLLGYGQIEEWDVRSDGGPSIGYSDCRHRSVEARPFEWPIEIREGEVTLLAVPGGEVGFEDLTQTLFARDDPYVTEAIGAWYPKIEDAIRAHRQVLVARLREPREGYDVYRDCDRKTAVVRTAGTPFSYVDDPNNPEARGAFRNRALGAFWGVRSVHASGFGGGCTGGLSFAVFMSDAKELEAAIEGAGAWLVREDLQGEIDIVISAMPVLQ